MKKRKFLKKAAVAAGVSAAVSYAFFYETMNRDGKLIRYIDEKNKEKNRKKNADKPKEPETEIQKMNRVNSLWAEGREFEPFDMFNERGQNLKGYFLPADKPSNVYVLCSHGYRSTGFGDFRFQMKFLHDKGYNIFLVDHQAAGNSDGQNISFGYYEEQDLRKWIDLMIDFFGDDIQIILYGISMGSATVTLASGNDSLPDNVKCTIADCGYTSMEDEFDFNLKNIYVPSAPLLKATNVINKYVSKFEYSDVKPAEAVKNAKVPILFIHGADDDFVPTYMACTLYNNCSGEKDLLIVDGAGHAESYQKNPIVYQEKFTEFTDKYIK